MAESNIEWTDVTWNPTTGCSKISEGCRNCYAERMAKRLQAMGNPRYVNGFKPTVHEDALQMPYTWKKPRKVFVNSMSDLYHELIPDEFIMKVFRVMNDTPLHTYQILTKRPERMLEISSKLTWTPNIWQGVTVEDNQAIYRIELLRKIPAAVRFLSCEPLLERIEDLPLEGIHWVIVGGESGPGARKMKEDWVRTIRDCCREQSVAFFFKQWGGVQKHRNGRILDGEVYNEFPV